MNYNKIQIGCKMRRINSGKRQAKVEANYGHGSLKVVMVRQLRRLSYPYKRSRPLGLEATLD